MKTNPIRHLSAIILAGAAMTSLAMPASASLTERPAPRETPGATQKATAARPATRYCIKEMPTGSHLINKVCKTRSEWMDRGFDPLAKN